jgi:predicted enzyme related to lactoylglutathione lyase
MRRKPHPYRQGELVIVLDCSDLDRSAGFWAAVLGHVPEVTVSKRYRSLIPASGDGIEILLQRVPEDKHHKNRLHLDLRTADLAAEVQRVLGLGATLLTTEPVIEEGWRWHILADPDGNEFCVLQPPAGGSANEGTVDPPAPRPPVLSGRTGRAEASGSEQVGLVVVARSGGEADDGAAHLLRGERRPHLVQVGAQIHPLLGGIGSGGGRTQLGRRSQLRHDRDEPDPERGTLGLRGRIRRDEPDGGLGPGVSPAQRRTAQRRPAGERDDHAARGQRKQERLAGPVEDLLDMPRRRPRG